MSSISFQNLFKNLGQVTPVLDPNQVDGSGNPVNNNLTGLGLTAADLKRLNTTPTSYLAGVSGPDATISNAAGNAVYQSLDGVTVGGAYQGDGRASVLAQKISGATQPVYPPGFTDANGVPLRASAVDANDFQSWTTGYQKEFIYDELFASGVLSSTFQTTGIPTAADKALLQSGTSLTIGSGATAVHVAIGPSLDAAGRQIPENKVKVIVVENLSKTAFATMSLAEQTLVASTAYFQSTLSVQLGLKVNPAVVTGAPTAVQSTISQILASAIATIISDASTNGVPIGTDGSYTGVAGQQDTQNNKNDGRRLNYTDVNLFLGQIAALQQQVAGMAVISEESIQTTLDAINQRYMQVSAFGSIPNMVSAADPSWGYHDANGNIDNIQMLTKNVVSADVATGAGATQTSTTVYLLRLQGSDVRDPRRVMADAFITDDDWNNSWSKMDPSMFTVNGQVQGAGKRFYVLDPDGTTKIWLDQGVVVQTDDQGRILGPVYTAAGFRIDSVSGYVDPKSYTGDKQTTTLANDGQQLIAQNASGYARIPLSGFNKNGNFPIMGANYAPTWTSSDGSTYTWHDWNNNSPSPIKKMDLPTTQPVSGQTNQTTTGGGYDKLISSEKKIAALKTEMDKVARSQSISSGSAGVDKSLDLPSLIFFMQFYTNLIKEQEVNVATEMVNQQNQLLNAYSQMQTLVNNAQSRFDPKDQTQELDLFGNKVDGSNNYSPVYLGSLVDPATGKPLTQQTYNILSMFDSVVSQGKTANPGGTSTVLNPIEKLFKINRPTQKIFEIGPNGTSGNGHTYVYTSTAWNSYGTSLSSAVTQINQQTQIMMNNINTLDKEKNQHFDLANNCLTKMNELLASIGRNVT